MNRAPSNLLLRRRTWDKLWKLRVQDRLKLILWKVEVGAIKTREALGRIFHREDEDQFRCPLCKDFPEDTLHLFVHCHVVEKAWCESFGLFN